MCKTPPSVSLVEGEVKQHRAAIKGERRRGEEEGGSAAQLLDKDWSAIPEYINSGCLCIIVFIMGITIRGTLCTATKIPFLCIPFPDFHIHVSVPHIFLQQNRQIYPGNILIAHRHMNVEIGTVWQRNSFSGNICFDFSVLFLCSVQIRSDEYQIQISLLEYHFCSQRKRNSL